MFPLFLIEFSIEITPTVYKIVIGRSFFVRFRCGPFHRSRTPNPSFLPNSLGPPVTTGHFTFSGQFTWNCSASPRISHVGSGRATLPERAGRLPPGMTCTTSANTVIIRRIHTLRYVAGPPISFRSTENQ